MSERENATVDAMIQALRETRSNLIADKIQRGVNGKNSG